MNRLRKPFKTKRQSKKSKQNQRNCRMCTKTRRKRIFVQTPFSQSSKILRSKLLDFLLQFLFWRKPSHYSKLTSQIMKMCEQIPETTRSGNPFKRHPTTHKTKRASTIYDYLEPKPLNKKLKTRKSNL